MLNPYATPKSITDENSDGNRKMAGFASRLIRAAAFALTGYVAPFIILIPMFSMKFGLHPPGDWVSGLADWHRPITINGLALLAPNVCCMVALGLAGLRSNSGFNPTLKHNRWFLIAIATLLGYATMLAVVFVLDPLPDSWSAERTNIVQSLFALLLPALAGLRWMWIDTNACTGEPSVATEAARLHF